ncbi:MAG: DUF481 domain-containing protein [Planctomycetes bacterium]|nr:DUF481 domain-containing protein [Planctomycetota bacterium]HPF13725.1 DUF481 domain-containing protein [Planctomycetota bacterium]HRV82543.1 DUF481 domain-containing protein [Planctomycetota bacterium]
MLFLPLVLTALHAVTPSLDQTQPVESLALSVAPLTADDAADADKKLDQWTGSVTLGLTYSDGNTQRKTLSATVDAIKDYSNKDRWTNNLYWNYAEEGGIRTQRRAGIRSQYDMPLDEKTYWFLTASADTDEQANLDLRWAAGAGLGHLFLDNEEWRFAGEAGLSYLNQEFKDGSTNDYVAARLAYRAHWTYSERLSFGQVTEIFPSVETSGDVYGRMDTRAVYQMTKSMLAQFQWIWDWNNNPAVGRDRSDNLFLVTVGWQY